MQTHYPITFTLDNGVKVQVSKTAGNTYYFYLTETGRTNDNFTYVEDNRTKEEVEESLDFNQLNALRTFWLKREELA